MTEAAERHLLVVDDDPRLRQLLQRFLVQQGYRVTVAADLAEARHALQAVMFDLVVLDVMLPDGDGMSFTAEIGRSRDLPVLLLTARGESEDRIAGLEAGAEDYLAKPFEPRELSLRIANILKRAKPAAALPAESLRFGQFVFHIGRAELRKGDDIVRLTDREREMLAVLAATPGETVPRMALAGNGGSVNERAVDVQINRLRRKIENDPTNPLIVQTVRGIGYRLVVSP
jgi:two-component system phosphate regulon response regulator OmpR